MSAPRVLLAALLGTAVGLVLGAAVGLRLAPPERMPPPRPAPTPADAVRVRELERELAAMTKAYAALARGEKPAARWTLRGKPDGEPAPAEEVPEEVATAAPAQPPQAFDIPALEDLGYTEQEAERLRLRFEAYELEQLYLGDRARRENWRGTPQFMVESRRLDEALLADLGDRDYDALLYAAGRPNRVKVAGVLAGSAAAGAGLREGDEVISYDGHRVFDARDLRRATSEGDAGLQTELRVRRSGEELRLLLPRGPIGMRMLPERTKPDGFH